MLHNELHQVLGHRINWKKEQNDSFVYLEDYLEYIGRKDVMGPNKGHWRDNRSFISNYSNRPNSISLLFSTWYNNKIFPSPSFTHSHMYTYDSMTLSSKASREPPPPAHTHFHQVSHLTANYFCPLFVLKLWKENEANDPICTAVKLWQFKILKISCSKLVAMHLLREQGKHF